MEAADLDRVVAIEHASFSRAWSRAQFIHELSLPFSHSAVAYRGESSPVVGYVVWWTVADEVHLLNVAVAPSERRTGLGRSLVDSVLRAAKRSGATLVTLEVSIHNRAARALYSGMHFVETHQRKNYYGAGDHAVVMERAL